MLEQLYVGTCTKNPIITLLIFHNLALCYQKTGQLIECGNCLKQCLMQIKKMVTQTDSINTKFKHLKYLSKVHMQYCAILSQLSKHTEALNHAKYGASYSHEIISQSIRIAEHYATIKYSSNTTEGSGKKPQNNDNFVMDSSILLNRPLGEPVELLELISRKILPILQELKAKCVPEGRIIGHNKARSEDLTTSSGGKRSRTHAPGQIVKLDMKNLFGYTSGSDWVTSLNIGNIMQISPITLQEVLSNCDFDIELTREALLEKIALLSVSYFCISTEKRFLAQDPANIGGSFGKQSEFWHAKSLEIACCFLPSECPLVNHIFASYQKHHSALLQVIVISFV